MSVLQTLRDRAGTLLAVVVGISLILFVVGDFFGRSSGQNRQTKKYYEIAEIGDDIISYQDYDSRIQNLIEIYKLSGTTTVTEALSESLREQIWEQMVEEKVLGEEIRIIGLGVSIEEVDALVLGNDPHPIVRQLFTNQQTGVFDQSFLVNFLKTTEYDPQAQMYWLFFEDEIVKTQVNSKLNNLISKGLYVTGKQAEYESNLTSNNVDFSFVMKTYGSVPDSVVTITRNDLEKYYQRKREDFRLTASRDIEYVEFEITPSEDDVLKSEENITSLKEEFASSQNPVQFINLNSDTRHLEVYRTADDLPEMLRDFALSKNLSEVYGPYVEDESYKIARLIDVGQRPDSVHARHILLSPDGTLSQDDLMAMADSLVDLIKSGTDFAQLALLTSADEASAQLGGDLGWFTEGIMVTPFNNACFEASEGDITTVETNFGVHIINVIEQSRSSMKYHLGIIERNITYSSLTYQDIYSQASRFAGINNTYEKFNKTIAEEGLSKKVGTDISPDQKELAGLESPRYLIMSLFDTKSKGIVLDRSEQAVFEIGNKFVIAYCTGIREEGYAKLEDVESDVRFEVIKQKKAEKLIAEMGKAIKDMNNIDDIAYSLDLSVMEATNINFNSFSIPGAGIEPAVISAASSSSEGTITSPIEGNNGVFIVAVNTVKENTQNQTVDLVKSRLSSNYQVRASFEAFQGLRKEIEIVDKRYKFY